MEIKNLNKILIVEDDKRMQEFLRLNLQNYAVVLQAFTRKEALNKFNSEPRITHIMMDGCLEKGNGPTEPDTIEITKEIRKNFKGIMLGISFTESYNEALKEAGCDHVISKEDCLGLILELLNYE
ncbi:hypothetical protein COT98_02685 [Candidatus Falkowbacteria bacterium CG10_big_fil_rev_8_21_14_0_10_39_9]|uniref:Response regulatory domain-containing protein n=1 Tax=Candidatus Falkowbacteria bacterium CG10_big_fil_rev_8_21_14_0_10_39_9 TaxID=1974566 RepID=A0A2M6WPC2_9BACT|nr:MAG: hypothetical protein COT98_02685 [Candidatus Falkowbacteria bacterium CG10_big_fil_rev_8_21_14_0_10_39_9]